MILVPTREAQIIGPATLTLGVPWLTAKVANDPLLALLILLLLMGLKGTLGGRCLSGWVERTLSLPLLITSIKSNFCLNSTGCRNYLIKRGKLPGSDKSPDISPQALLELIGLIFLILNHLRSESAKSDELCDVCIN